MEKTGRRDEHGREGLRRGSAESGKHNRTESSQAGSHIARERCPELTSFPPTSNRAARPTKTLFRSSFSSETQICTSSPGSLLAIVWDVEKRRRGVDLFARAKSRAFELMDAARRTKASSKVASRPPPSASQASTSTPCIIASMSRVAAPAAGATPAGDAADAGSGIWGSTFRHPLLGPPSLEPVSSSPFDFFRS